MRIVTASLATTLAAVLTAAPALADELWTSPEIGTIEYLADVGDTAVFVYYEGAGFLYVPGLPSTLNSRYTYYGYWIETGYDLCGVTLTGPDGVSSSAFGSAIVTFNSTSFPSSFSVQIGACFDPASDVIYAEPIVGPTK